MPSALKTKPAGVPLFIYYNGRKRAVGYHDLVTHTWLKTRLDPKKHLLRLAGDTPGWQKETYEALAQLGLLQLRAETTDGRAFTVSFSTFDKFKFEKDFGHGPQYVLEARFWQIGSKEQERLW